MKRQGMLMVISGPSGAGKGTLCKELLKRNNDINLSISATTRAPRIGEEDGKNYFFISKDKFENMIKNDEFLEYAKVYDNYYGTPKKYVLENIEMGKDVLLEIDIVGALQIKEKFPDGVFVFILPPSLGELRKRIVGRGTESKEDIEKRYSSAVKEIEQLINYEYIVLNEDVERATLNIESILNAEACRVSRVYNEIQSRFK